VPSQANIYTYGFFCLSQASNVSVLPERESHLLSGLRAIRLTLSPIGGTLASNVQYFRHGEHPGRTSSSDPENFLCSEVSGSLAEPDGQPRMIAPGPWRQVTDPR
jgi:hypothetical protein